MFFTIKINEKEIHVFMAMEIHIERKSRFFLQPTCMNSNRRKCIPGLHYNHVYLVVYN